MLLKSLTAERDNLHRICRDWVVVTRASTDTVPQLGRPEAIPCHCLSEIGPVVNHNLIASRASHDLNGEACGQQASMLRAEAHPG